MIAELRVLREPDLNALSATCVIILAVVGGVLYHFSDAAFGEFAERRLWTD